MRTLYKSFISGLFFFGLSIICLGQGIVSTERNSPAGAVSFSENSKLTGISDAKHVDGYVKKYGSSLFAFPVGQNGVYRPFGAEADGTIGAYFQGDPGTASLPAGGPFSTNNKEDGVKAVSTKELWDIKGTKATKITLSWNAASDVSVLTGGALSTLSMVGWNTSMSRWEKITSIVDQVSLFGNASSLTSGSVTTTQTLAPDTYKAYTLAALTTASLPVNYSGSFEVAGCTEITGWVWDSNYPNSALSIELIEGDKVYATTTAHIYRADLKSSGIGTGNYGFSLGLPSNLMGDGLTHQLSIRVRSSNYILAGSPRALSCAFAGNFEQADCNDFQGWVWDKNMPERTFTVELIENDVVHATTVSNIYREDLKNLGIGNGSYGFSMPFPNSLKDGKSHVLNAKIKGLNYILPNSGKTQTCALPQYFGNFEVADCNQIVGWVWDRSYPNMALVIELYEGATVYATTVANVYRENIKNAGYGTGSYGFILPMPVAVKDGNVHQLSVRVKGTGYILGGSPRSVSCAANQFQGNFDAADCTQLVGWAWDKNAPNSAVTVELFEGTTVYGSVVANAYRESLKNAGIGTGSYGFSMPTPAALRDGKSHQLSFRIKGTNTILTSSPRPLTCTANLYQGSFEVADCNQLIGWVWDKYSPNGAALTVELVEGTTVYGTAVADIYRENLKNAGIGTGNYGFSIPTPAALKDGNPHQISFRVKGSSTVLTNSPKTLTCAANLYQGSFDVADCNQLVGWVWDKFSPSGAALTVELVEGTTVYGTAVANLYRENLKNAGIGTGNYGFSMPTPATLKNGNPHQLSFRIKGSTTILTNSPRALTCATNLYQGSFDVADCNQLTGWVWDKYSPNGIALTVELVEGTTVHGTAVANIYRDNLKNAGIGTGNYGFSMPTPAALKDGNPHQLSFRIKGTSTILTNSPKALTCIGTLYRGSFDVADCNQLVGWVWDKNAPNTTLTVELVEGTTVHGTAVANIYRENLKNAGIGTGNYGFSIPTPAALKDGNPHQLSFRIKGSTAILTNSPKALTCIGNLYRGSFDVADCNQLVGWVWDKNAPSTTLTVELLEGTTVYGTAVANIFRENLKNAGIGTGNYGFSIPTPAALKDGNPHQLSFRIKGSTTILTNSPKALTCVGTLYRGSFDVGDCNQLIGWAWDKNAPNAILTVELLEGTIVYATAVANIYRENLKNAGIGTGNYGFAMPTPIALKDGKSHQLSFRIKGSSTILTNSPKTLTCGASARFSSENKLDVDDTEKQSQFNVAPNPTSGKIRASFKVPATKSVELSVMSLVGNVVWQQRITGAGEHYEQWIDLSNYQSGMYLVILKMADNTETKRIVLVK